MFRQETLSPRSTKSNAMCTIRAITCYRSLSIDHSKKSSHLDSIAPKFKPNRRLTLPIDIYKLSLFIILVYITVLFMPKNIRHKA